MKKISIFLMMLCFAIFGVANAQTLFSEGFEGGSMPTGWTTDGPGTWSVGSGDYSSSTGAGLGTYNALIKHSTTGDVTKLITPTIDLSSVTSATLSFMHVQRSWAGDIDELRVYYRTSSTGTWTQLVEYTGAVASWTTEEDIALPNTSATYQLAFEHTDNYGYGVGVDNVIISAPPACPKPTNLAATTDGETATITWDGTAANGFIIDINGTPVTGQTSPYTFNVELSTTYNVTVTADCDAAGTSESVSTSFTTPDCIGGRVIEYTLNDSYGDGWNGNAIQVVEGCDIIATLTIENGYSETGTLTLCGDYYEFVWVNGSYASETSFTFSEGGTTLFTKPSSVSDGMVLYTIGTQAMPKPTDLTAGTPEAHSVALSWTENGTATAWQICVNGDETNLIEANSNPFTLTGLDYETAYTVKVRSTDRTGESCWSAEVTFTSAASPCTKPTDLAEENISFTTADLSWEGTSDSYVLQYRPWNPAGDDIITTSTLTTYTVDLSQYEGIGSVAIRHYDISDMFQLIVDNIEVTNAAGTVVYSQDFEDCGGNMPVEFTNMDLDGDGFTWQIASSPSSNVDGTYGIVSESYNNDYGALTPDNWLILSGIQMGGQMTFQARGQDPAYAAENFAIYVSTENSIVEVPVTATTYNVTDLTPNTPYAWQVKGICEADNEESGWASSFFKTKDDMLVFATAGNWNVVSNWKDAEGNAVAALPTADNNVRIDAAAVIPANYVANANKVTIGTGSITIKDGGQLKQSAATLRVTMEKEIAGYGESDGNYYFIASPFNGRTKFGNDGSTWSLVDNILEGEYDLYAFDPTEELEWINYQANPGHISFLSEPTSSGSGNPGMLYGEGYLYANQDDTTLEFIGTTGKSNNYSETRDYTFDGESTDDWNGWKLVGNMFTCNAYINYVDADGEVMEADFYTLNNDNTYNLSSSNVGLAPCTGAFINYSATGKVQYATEAPAKANRSGMINMNVSRGNKTVGQARVRFGQGHNLGSMSFRNGSRIYMNVDGNDYAVVYTENQGEMPVSFRAAENGTYTLTFNTEDVELGYLHLIDNMTGNDVNLLSTPSYSFEASTTDYASRFRLVFATGNADDDFAFFSNGSFVINNEGNATVQVMDVNGRIISSDSINGCASVNVKAAAGVYMIRLVNGSNVKVQKVVVK